MPTQSKVYVVYRIRIARFFIRFWDRFASLVSPFDP